MVETFDVEYASGTDDVDPRAGDPGRAPQLDAYRTGARGSFQGELVGVGGVAVVESVEAVVFGELVDGGGAVFVFGGSAEEGFFGPAESFVVCG